MTLDIVDTVDTVFLDLGNVLVFHDDEKLLRELAALGGRSVDEIRNALAPLWDPCHRGHLAGDGLREAVSRVVGAPLHRDAFRRVWNCHFRIHDAVMPLVEALADRVKLFLLSNTNAAHIEFVRPLLPILERFDGLVLSYQVGLAKPEPEIFAAALKMAGTRPEHAAYFDDVETYVVAAQALGIRGRVFTDAPTFRKDLRELGLA